MLFHRAESDGYIAVVPAPEVIRHDQEQIAGIGGKRPEIGAFHHNTGDACKALA